MRKPEQYRISPSTPGSKQTAYKLQVTWGLLDVQTLGIFAKSTMARKFAKEHASQHGIANPIILT
jgi:hypothetical protein